MHFCSECHNMYYLKISEENGNIINYYCRNCGHEDTSLKTESICVSETQLRRGEQKFTNMVNEYTKYDPTLPRINTIKCPNQECLSNGGKGAKPMSKADVLAVVEEEEGEGEELIEGGAGTGTGTSKKKLNIKETAKQTAAKQATAAKQSTAAKQEQYSAAAAKQTNTSVGTSNQREVIYIRYDDINMKYVYLCVHCDTTWKTDHRN